MSRFSTYFLRSTLDLDPVDRVLISRNLIQILRFI